MDRIWLVKSLRVGKTSYGKYSLRMRIKNRKLSTFGYPQNSVIKTVYLVHITHQI